MSKKSFKAQALAIVMVVLVVASIIGIALFSRMSKDKQIAIEEQNSATAAELAEGVLDIVIGVDIDTLESKVPTSIDNLSALETFISDEVNGLGMDLTAVDFPNEADWCTPAENSSFEFSIDLLGPNEGVEVRPGSVVAYHIQGATIISNPCVLPLTLDTTEDYAIFIVKSVYEDGSSNVDNYCLNDGSLCDDLDDDVDDNGNIDSIPLTENPPSYHLYPNVDDPTLSEIRILPIKGSISIALGDTGCISDRQFNYVKVTTEANCNGSYRAKEIVLPGSGNLGYSTLFDYGIYDMGDFRLKH